MARHKALSTRYSDRALGFSQYRNVVSGLLSIDSVRGKFLRKVMDRIHAKVGDRDSCILGGLFTLKVEMRMTD